MWFCYATAKTKDRIHAILEDCWAQGEIGENEPYRIEHTNGRWRLMLRGN